MLQFVALKAACVRSGVAMTDFLFPGGKPAVQHHFVAHVLDGVAAGAGLARGVRFDSGSAWRRRGDLEDQRGCNRILARFPEQPRDGYFHGAGDGGGFVVHRVAGLVFNS